MVYVSQVSESEGPFVRFMHMHPQTVELILITEGEGEYFIGDRIYPVRKGDLLVYNSQVVHDEYLESGRPVGTICCAINHIERPGLRANALIPDARVPVIPLYHHYETVLKLMSSIFTMINQRAVDGPAMAQLLTRVLLKYIEGNVLLCVDNDEIARNDNLLDVIKNYIDLNFSEPIRLETLASKFNVSPWFVSHEFKRRYGYAPMDYLIKRRLGEAQSLLTTDDGGREKITSIAYRVGFSNLSYFQYYFKNKVGKTPGQYRKDYRKANFLFAEG
ncbi:myo-inositol utilization transcriptional regulator ReiD [Phytobacter sp. V91]|uniref:myo-inositol utilization transcriptional regulator ReiD n=1 Tax=Phytobacter sp. V91 TaxID=3369425 RepID=UPI003F607C9A